MYNRLPPQAVEIEEVVLGAMMLEAEAVPKVIDFLSADMFYKPAHALVFKAIGRLYNRKEGVDMMTVAQELRKSDELESIGGIATISQLTNSVVSGAHVYDHAKIVYEKFLKRSLIATCTRLNESGYDDTIDAFALIEDAENAILALNRTINLSQAQSTATLVRESLDNIARNMQRKSDVIGLPTGWPMLDSLTLGWQAPDLIIIAARPAMGKTAFALNIARNCPVPVGFFSLEMSALQLTERVQANDAGIGLTQIKRGDVSQGQLKVLYESADRIAAKPIFIHDESNQKISEICARARRLVAKEKVGLIIVDYLQLINGKTGLKGENRDQEIGNITRTLKQLAKELHIPIITLCQLSRKVEERQVKIPVLSDLRESGNIEQDADIVCFLYRPEYYGITQDENGESMSRVAILDFAKHRNGELDKVMFKVELDIQRFSKQDDAHSNHSPLSEIINEPINPF